MKLFEIIIWSPGFQRPIADGFRNAPRTSMVFNMMFLPKLSRPKRS